MLTLPLPVVHPNASRRRTAADRGRSVWRVLALAATATLHVLAVGTLLLPDRQQPPQRAVEPVLVHEVEIALSEASAPPAPPPLPPPPQAARLYPAPAPTEAPPLPMPVPAPIAPVLATPTPAVPATVAPAPVANPARSEPAVTAVAPSAPAAPADRASAQAYMRLLAAALQQQRNYPGEARKQRLQGVVAVRFTLDRAGHVLAMAIARSSGHALLDQAALAVLQRADPLPAIPPEFGQDRLTVTVPIEYSLITR